MQCRIQRKTSLKRRFLSVPFVQLSCMENTWNETEFTTKLILEVAKLVDRKKINKCRVNFFFFYSKIINKERNAKKKHVHFPFESTDTPDDNPSIIEFSLPKLEQNLQWNEFTSDTAIQTLYFLYHNFIRYNIRIYS